MRDTGAVGAENVAARAGNDRPKAAFFGYSWSGDLRPEGYMAASIDGLVSLGVDVDFYLGNDYTDRFGTIGVASSVSMARLVGHVRAQHYDFAISFNNALVTPNIVDALDCRAVCVIVDSENHLFDHDERGGFAAFDLNVAIAPIYSSLRQVVERRFPKALERFHFHPPATDVHARTRGSRIDRSMPVSWIATLAGDPDMDALIHHVTRHAADFAIFMRCVRQVETTGYLDKLQGEDDVQALALRLRWQTDVLERHVQNIVTNTDRAAVVRRLSSRGLRLYGNDRWSTLLASSLDVARSLVIGERIVSHEQQMGVYNASLLSINLPQAQAKTGLQYRMIDVMASRALLISKFVPGSDLYEVFGTDCPVPTFDSIDRLAILVDHYLANERERRELVAHCNRLVSTGFSFAERALDYLRLSNPVVAARLGTVRHADDGSVGEERGSVRVINRSLFTNWTGPR